MFLPIGKHFLPHFLGVLIHGTLFWVGFSHYSLVVPFPLYGFMTPVYKYMICAEVCAIASNHAYKFLADSLGLPPSNVPNNN